MFRREGIPVLIKRILLFAVVLTAALLQNTSGLIPTFFGARLFLLIPVTVCIGMWEGELSGLIYGMVAGAFWDVCAMGPDGIFALILALIGCMSGLLVHFVMRNRLASQLCLCAFSSTACLTVFWFASVYVPVGDGGFDKLLGFYLPSAVVTTLFSFLVYYFIKLISLRLSDRDDKSF